MRKPFEGVRVVDFSVLTSAPLATMVLADQGADVVKVENTVVGDIYRLSAFSKGGVTALLANHSRGKRSIAVDTGIEEGRQVVQDLMVGADVIVQNFRPGVVDRLGLGYGDIRAHNPDVIYVSVSGFGPDGPYADRPIVDPVIQALTGMVARQQSEDLPIPDLVRQVVVDKATALMVAQAVGAALYRRAVGGGGDHIVVPMLDVGLYFFWPDGMCDQTLLDEGVASGSRPVDGYRITQCADGPIVYYAVTRDQLRGIYGAVGHPEWADDPRFCDVAALGDPDNLRTLGALLIEAFGSMKVDDVLPGLHAAQVPAAPVLQPHEVVTDAQVVHNGSLVTWEHPTAGTLRQPRHPIRFSSSPTPVPEQVPLLGEHTDEILAELGRTPDQIDALRAAGII